LKRIAPKMPLVVFVTRQGPSYRAFAYTNGTWFEMRGVQADDSVRWRLTQGEPYLRRTFKGSTEELVRVVRGCLSRKAKPPEVDSKAEPGFGPEVAPAKGAERKSNSEGERARSASDGFLPSRRWRSGLVALRAGTPV